jgi:hypothetical protein
MVNKLTIPENVDGWNEIGKDFFFARPFWD